MSNKNTNTVKQAEKRAKLLKEAKIAQKEWNAATKVGNKEYAKIVKVELKARNEAAAAAWAIYVRATAPTEDAYSKKRGVAQKAFDKIVAPSSDKFLKAQRALNRASYGK
jgi:hypothetical protein